MAKAITAMRQGNRTEARRLIISVLKENPHSEVAWSWACEVADSPEERVHCLKQILNLNPDHTEARRYLTQLQAASPTEAPESTMYPPAPITNIPSRANNAKMRRRRAPTGRSASPSVGYRAGL